MSNLLCPSELNGTLGLASLCLRTLPGLETFAHRRATWKASTRIICHVVTNPSMVSISHIFRGKAFAIATAKTNILLNQPKDDHITLVSRFVRCSRRSGLGMPATFRISTGRSLRAGDGTDNN
jgi:hypothetical protein